MIPEYTVTTLLTNMNPQEQSSLKGQHPQSDEALHIIEFLDKMTYFDDWDATMKKDCEKFSKIKCFGKDEIIYGDNSNTNQYVHFIMEGTAKAVQIIEFTSTCNKNILGTNTPDVYFIEVFRLSKTSCFNIGEDLHERIIIACCNNTQCLLVPKFWILEINKKLWHRMRFFFERNIPSKEETEKRFYRKKKFCKQSEYLVKRIQDKSKKSQYNNFFNVPFSLRLNQI